MTEFILTYAEPNTNNITVFTFDYDKVLDMENFINDVVKVIAMHDIKEESGILSQSVISKQVQVQKLADEYNEFTNIALDTMLDLHFMKKFKKDL